MVAGSFAFRNDGWWSGFLLEVGAAFLLFALFWELERRVLDRVEGVEASVRATAEKLATLSDRVMSRLSEERVDEIEPFVVVGRDDVQLSDVVRALAKAHAERFLIETGIRVSMVSKFVRFVPPIAADDDHLEMVLEESNGDEIDRIRWERGQSVEEFIVRFIRLLNKRGLYPGDPFFDPNELLGKLATDLQLMYNLRHGIGRGQRSVWPLESIPDKEWAITEYGVEYIDPLGIVPYQIEWSRMDELDWDPHVTSKGWVDVADFRMAFETAVALRRNGRQPAPPERSAARSTDL